MTVVQIETMAMHIPSLQVEHLRMAEFFDEYDSLLLGLPNGLSGSLGALCLWPGTGQQNQGMPACDSTIVGLQSGVRSAFAVFYAFLTLDMFMQSTLLA